MDFSEQYIKMCQQASRLRELWIPKDADFVIDVYNERRGNAYAMDVDQDNHDSIIEDVENGKLLVVYRQDQLWDFVDEYKNKNHRIFRFYDFLKKKYLSFSNQNGYTIITNMFDSVSMEKLLLCFVMNEKYNKIWDKDKEDWVNKGRK